MYVCMKLEQQFYIGKTKVTLRIVSVFIDPYSHGVIAE